MLVHGLFMASSWPVHGLFMASSCLFMACSWPVYGLFMALLVSFLTMFLLSVIVHSAVARVGGCAALHLAAARGLGEVVEVLLEGGVDPDAR